MAKAAAAGTLPGQARAVPPEERRARRRAKGRAGRSPAGKSGSGSGPGRAAAAASRRERAARGGAWGGRGATSGRGGLRQPGRAEAAGGKRSAGMGEKLRGEASPVLAGKGLEMTMKKPAFACSCHALSELGFRVELVSIMAEAPLGQAKIDGVVQL